MDITVKLKNIRKSPTKIRPTLYLVRGKNATAALDIMKFTANGTAPLVYKLIKSGISAAKSREMSDERLYIKEIKCDGAGMYKRHRYGSRGRVVKILKRNSHLTLTISDEVKAVKADVKPEKKEEEIIAEKEIKTEATEKTVKPKKDSVKKSTKKEDK